MTTGWKKVAMSISNHYLPLLCTHHVMPSTECGLHNGPSAIDHLRVLPDHINYCCSVVIVVDDIRHAYG